MASAPQHTFQPVELNARRSALSRRNRRCALTTRRRRELNTYQWVGSAEEHAMSDTQLADQLQMFERGRPVVPTRAEGPVDYTQPLRVFAVPGCSACLRTKEYLTKWNVPFISV